MSNKYKNVIFTKHALERMKDRSIGKDKIWKTINYPDHTKRSNTDGKKYISKIKDRNYQAVATYLKDEKKYLVISAWVRGEDDKQGILWILVTLPFKIIWWLLKKFW